MTYELDHEGSLHIIYDAKYDMDTVLNMTNHSYFNLAGHEKTDSVMEHVLIMPGRFFCPDNAENIPTGELRDVEGTPMDFISPNPLCRISKQTMNLYTCKLDMTIIGKYSAIFVPS